TGETMSEGSEMPPNVATMPVGAMGDFPVPLSSLAQPDDNEAMQTPAVGDEPEVLVRLKINRIEGEQAFVTPLAVNGKELGEKSPVNPNAADEQEGSDLRAMALNV